MQGQQWVRVLLVLWTVWSAREGSLRIELGCASAVAASVVPVSVNEVALHEHTLQNSSAAQTTCIGASAGAMTAVPVSIDEVLLRGCTLKNSGRVAGLVVYTGAETRIQMNAAAPPRKRGALRHNHGQTLP